MNDEEFPGLNERKLTESISWHFYKHWGQGYLAGEGIEQVHGDHSGCVHVINGIDWTNVPTVVQARLYTSEKGSISAVYSYPNGIAAWDRYFWEIYNAELVPDPERFELEEEMERRVMEVLE